jgi:hypothetical protein
MEGLQKRRKIGKGKPMRNPINVLSLIIGVLFAALLIWALSGCVTTPVSAKSFTNPAPLYYLTYVKNENATPFTFLLKMKVNNRIRVQQSLKPGKTSIPLKLKRGYVYTLVFWCEVDQATSRIEFKDAIHPITLHGHDCTDFGGGGNTRRKAA